MFVDPDGRLTEAEVIAYARSLTITSAQTGFFTEEYHTRGSKIKSMLGVTYEPGQPYRPATAATHSQAAAAAVPATYEKDRLIFEGGERHYFVPGVERIRAGLQEAHLDSSKDFLSDTRNKATR